MPTADLIGYIAACLTTSSFLPQAIKVFRTRDTGSLSLLMYIAFNLGVVLWLVYGLLRNDPVIIVANCVTLLLSMSILAIKIYNVLTKVDQ
ncbi:MtN3 and saliva related transmembrane protein [Alteromonadaceae bacterium Bs31]|nr:MtN3 and saliva related transmembrane protein [Alteromonadaceae bacterium Bs31]